MSTNRRYTYRCNTCRNEYTYDQPGEPMCTGPGELDAHEPEVMWRIKVTDPGLGDKHVSPQEGQARAEGTLLTPEALVLGKARVKGKLWIPDDGINPWTGEEMHPDDQPSHGVEVTNVAGDEDGN